MDIDRIILITILFITTTGLITIHIGGITHIIIGIMDTIIIIHIMSVIQESMVKDITPIVHWGEQIGIRHIIGHVVP